MRPSSLHLTNDTPPQSLPLPCLRAGVVLVGEGEDAELRDLRLGQVVKLGEVAAIIVSLLDGTRDAQQLLHDAQLALEEELNPYGLVELLQALDRRALLDTPRARMVVSQGLMRADIAALQKLARRVKPLHSNLSPDASAAAIDATPNLAPDTRFSCNSCNRCCSEHHLLGPVTRVERDAILSAFGALEDPGTGADPSNFLPLPTNDSRELFLLRARNGYCSYLGSDGLCSVHKILGEDLKPAVCRMFPYRIVRTPLGFDAGLSLGCPTVAAGAGGDPRPEARSKLAALPVFAPLLSEVPPSLPLGEGVQSAWGDYARWEARAIALIQDDDMDPAEAWVRAVVELSQVLERLCENHSGAETTTEFHVSAPDPSTIPVKEGDKEFVPEMGMGDCPESPVAAADVFARDVALWAELLIGLEAADPDSLRHLRASSTRLREQVGHAPEAAPLLAEKARLRYRAEREAARSGEFTTMGDLDMGSPDMQRRFLVQALMEKRLFEFGSVARGTAQLSLLLAVMRLEEAPGDELRATIGDLAYLVHHPQLTDVIDTRAVVRAFGDDPAFHASLLGVTLSDGV